MLIIVVIIFRRLRLFLAAEELFPSGLLLLISFAFRTLRVFLF